ncbi:hypothetical protein C1N91_05650 [Curtobacterium sp. SGAir0471]|uniref:hypothetical protein n=1 Tax=Curtobacterium sp. SGAir0471 TaxID=2070337 RepID=UPI0010CD258D|nr:hypothetical protein [Curtobacterium sp. SGAir0471]QCR43105.1 hypothetical protein C1N91_05650 [Curtobacterium sp. SGAir0471]
MVDDVAWSPPRRRNGIWWIVASGLLLPAGWVAWLLVALAGYNGAGMSTHSLAGQTIGSAVVTVVCVGVPLAGLVLLLVQRRRDRAVTLVGPVGCAVFVVLAAVSLGYPTVRIGQAWAEEEEQRAQPLTPRETSRTQAEAEQDLADVGERAVRAMGGDPESGDVVQFPRGCPLSNLEQGTEYTWRWSFPADADAADEPQTEAERKADLLPQDQAEGRLAPVREVFLDAGLRDADPLGWDIRVVGDDWLAEGNAGVTRTSGDVMVETTCLAGGPGDGYDEDE